VAGVRELVMVSPAPKPLVLAAAALAEVDRVIGIGGAQAVGALAYGTRSVPRVDKIVGPGHVYVAEAKRQVVGQVGTDIVAGRSATIARGRTTSCPLPAARASRRRSASTISRSAPASSACRRPQRPSSASWPQSWPKAKG